MDVTATNEVDEGESRLGEKVGVITVSQQAAEENKSLGLRSCLTGRAQPVEFHDINHMTGFTVLFHA